MNNDSDSLTIPDEIFTVRGRPVAYRRARFGGELHAIERGYFPVSHTGYRSMSCGPAAPTPTQEILDKLALENERETSAMLTSCRRAFARLQGDSLQRYIHLSHHATSAINRGFFARDDDRILLWQHAYRLLTAIADTPAFQPEPTGGAWNSEHCAQAIARVRLFAPWVARLLAGDLAECPTAGHGGPFICFAADAYLTLPPRTTPEPTGAIPAIAQDFAFASGLESNRHEADAEDQPEDQEPDSGAPSPTPDLAGPATLEVSQLELF